MKKTLLMLLVLLTVLLLGVSCDEQGSISERKAVACGIVYEGVADAIARQPEAEKNIVNAATLACNVIKICDANYADALVNAAKGMPAAIAIQPEAYLKELNSFLNFVSVLNEDFKGFEVIDESEDSPNFKSGDQIPMAMAKILLCGLKDFSAAKFYDETDGLSLYYIKDETLKEVEEVTDRTPYGSLICIRVDAEN